LSGAVQIEQRLDGRHAQLEVVHTTGRRAGTDVLALEDGDAFGVGRIEVEVEEAEMRDGSSGSSEYGGVISTLRG